MWPTPTLVTAYNLVPSLMHLLSCCRSFTSTAYCTIRREQRWATYTDVVSERWTHTHSLVTCKHPHSFTQTNTHTDILFFAWWYGRGGGTLFRTQTNIPAPPTSPPLDVCVNSKLCLAFDLSGEWYPCLLPCSQHPHMGCKENYSLFSPHNKSVWAQRAAAFT